MKTIIIFTLLISAISIAQERSYIEFIPMASWEETGSGTGRVPSFDWGVGAHIMLNRGIAIKPFIAYTNKIRKSSGVFGTIDLSEHQWRVGMALRLYIGG